MNDLRQAANEVAFTDVEDVIANAPLTRGLIRIVLLCGLAAMIDGFDVQILSFVAPVLARDWGVHPSAFAGVFAAGLIGIMIGQFLLTPLADRFGRKAMILVGMTIFAILSFATAFARDIETLLVFRFLGGIGLGGVTPNLIALTAEYSPRRLRGAAITIMFGGFSLGAVAGGLLSSVMVPAYGWPSMFVVGGVVPLAMALVLAMGLPESIRFLILRRSGQEAAIRVLNAYWRDRPRPADEKLVVNAPPMTGLSVRHLFGPGQAASTILLWSIYFVSLLLTYFLLSWLPTILVGEGAPLPVAQRLGAVLSLGGIVGGIALGFAIDRLPAVRVLIISYLLAGLSIAMIGFAGHGGAILIFTAFAAGFFTIGSQTALNATVADLYPAAVRATGLGYAMGVGRLGSIVGPIVGGALIAAQWPANALFAITAIPAAFACMMLFALAAVHRRR